MDIVLILVSFAFGIGVGMWIVLFHTEFTIKKLKRLPSFLKDLVTINEEKGGATGRK